MNSYLSPDTERMRAASQDYSTVVEGSIIKLSLCSLHPFLEESKQNRYQMKFCLNGE